MVLTVLGTVIAVFEAAILAVFVATGYTTREALTGGILPAALLLYGVYLASTNLRKLRGFRG